jgi:hypothetical protein
MRRGFAILLLSLAPAWSQVKPAAVIASSNLPAAKAARIPLDDMKDLERAFNYRLASLADVNEPMELMGDFRAVQLDDYGVVVTSEVSLVVTPGLMPGRPKIPPELAARVHKQRVERLPLLKTGMKEMMRNMAAAFTQIPAGQQMVLVVRLWYGPWEDTTGMPAQVVMRADRASAAAGKVEMEER